MLSQIEYKLFDKLIIFKSKQNFPYRLHFGDHLTKAIIATMREDSMCQAKSRHVEQSETSSTNFIDTSLSTQYDNAMRHVERSETSNNETSILESKISTLLDSIDNKQDLKLTLDRLVNLVNKADSKQEYIYDLTQQEKQAQFELVKNFYPNIKKINDNHFVYKNYSLPINVFEPSVFYYSHGLNTMESKTLDSIANKDIIDVGGYSGDSALVMLNFTNKLIHTFEPLALNFENILKTIKLNNVTRIKPIQKGLGAKNENLQINLNNDSSCASLAYNNGNLQENIEVITLDSYVQEHNLSVGFIKVDIEGFESEFLKGAMETIKSQRPALLLSIYHNANDFFNIMPMLYNLNLNYKFRFYKGGDFNLLTESVLLCEPQE